MAKSPTRRSRQSNSPFSKAQEIWIIQRSATMRNNSFFIRRQTPRTTLLGRHGIHMRRWNVKGKVTASWWRGVEWLMGGCWWWGGWWMRMDGRSQWPRSDTKRCCKAKSGRRYKIDQVVGSIGSGKMAQHLTPQISTSTFWRKSFAEEWSLAKRKRNISGLHTASTSTP